MTLPIEQISASEAKGVPRCRHFGPCGGCSLQDLPYEQQIRLKTERLVQLLQQEMSGCPLPVLEVIPSPDPWGYRSKMEFTFGEEEGRVTVGLHQRRSFQKIVDIQNCEIAPAPVSRLLSQIRRIAGQLRRPSYHSKTHQGFWRYAVVRANTAGNLLLLLVTNEGLREPIDALAMELLACVPELKSFYWGVSTRISDVARPERLERISGADHLEDQLGEVRFLLGPTQFVQPNLRLVPRVYEAIRARAALTGRETVYDLYCGIGLISLFLAPDAQTVVGVESEPENIAMAERNAALNGRSNVLFLCGKTEDLIKGQALFRLAEAAPGVSAHRLGAPDCVVLDPPRAGLHKEVVVPLLQARPPVILYLSCNPASLARDLRVILEREPAYRVESLQMFDLFPHTQHMEVLATLRYNC